MYQGIVIPKKIEKRVVPKKIDQAAAAASSKGLKSLGEITFTEWKSGRAGGLSIACGDAYPKAVREHGFKGHQGKWRDFVLRCGEMKMTDFRDAPGYKS